jgi:hypothetical protein
MLQPCRNLRSLEGQRVLVYLTDGSRIDDCQLVSVARGTVGSVWLVDHGQDRFVALVDVVDLVPQAPTQAKPAA